MSTKGSIRYHAIGSYRWHTEFSVHYYEECFDRSRWLTLTAFNVDVLTLRLRKPTRSPAGDAHAEIRRRYDAGEREIHVTPDVLKGYDDWLTEHGSYTYRTMSATVDPQAVKPRRGLMFKDAEVWTDGWL